MGGTLQDRTIWIAPCQKPYTPNPIFCLTFLVRCANILAIDRVAVEGRPSTALPKPCVRLSPHTAFQLSVAIYALGDDNHFYFIPYS